MPQESQSDATLAPWAAHSERANPAHVGIIIRMRAAQVNAGDLPGRFINGKKPQGRVKVLCSQHKMLKSLEANFKGLLYIAKVITKRVFLRAVDGFGIGFGI